MPALRRRPRLRRHAARRRSAVSSSRSTVASPGRRRRCPRVVLLVGHDRLRRVGAGRRSARWSRPTGATPPAPRRRGVGELLAAALDAGARRIVVGLGGSATNDAGAGAWSGWPRARVPGPADVLGARRRDARRRDRPTTSPGCATLRDRLARRRARRRHRRGRPAARAARRERRVRAAEGRDARAGAGPRARARPLRARRARRPSATRSARTCWPARVRRPTASRLTAAPGAGAAGGLGFGLALLGGRLVPGSALVADAVGPRRPDRRHRRRGHRRGHGSTGSRCTARSSSEVASRALAARGPDRRRRGGGARRVVASCPPRGSRPPTRSARRPDQVAAALAAPARSRSRRAGRPAWREPGHVERNVAPRESYPGREQPRRPVLLPRLTHRELLSSEHPGETMSETTATQNATETHGVLLTDVAAVEGPQPARAGGPRRPPSAGRRPARWLLRPDLPAVLRRAGPRRRRRQGLRRCRGRRGPHERARTSTARRSTSPTRSRSRASRSTTRTPAAPARAAARSADLT